VRGISGADAKKCRKFSLFQFSINRPQRMKPSEPYCISAPLRQIFELNVDGKVPFFYAKIHSQRLYQVESRNFIVCVKFSNLTLTKKLNKFLQKINDKKTRCGYTS